MSDYPPPPPPGPGEPQYPGAYQPGDYPPQGYPSPYPPAGYGQPGYPPAARPALAARLGERLVRRPEPRFTVAIAGAGAVLALVGVLVWTGTYLGHGLAASFSGEDSGPPSTNRNLLGGAVFAVLAIIGYVVALARRDGPLATAGAVVGAIGIPLALGFLTFDIASSSDGFPFNLDATVWVSIAIWLGSYLFVPGMRARTFLVFLIALFFYDYVLFQSVKSDIGRTVSSTLNGGESPRSVGLGTIMAVGLVFGLGYYAIAFALDARGKHGPATGLLYTAFGATLSGIVASYHDLKVTGAAVLGLVISVPLAWYAGRYGRRLTCFLWGGGVAASIVVIVGDNVHDGIGAGITIALIGLVVIVVAQLAALGLREPADMDPAVVVRSR